MAEPYSGMIDVVLGYDTDLAFENGDLMRTTGIDYIEREVYKLLISSQGDWKVHPQLGASPNKFTGQPNTREVARQLEVYLLSNLRETVSPGQLRVKVVPLDRSEIAVYIDIIVDSQVISSRTFKVDYVLGFRGEMFDSKTTDTKSGTHLKQNTKDNPLTYNKYWDRLGSNRKPVGL